MTMGTVQAGSHRSKQEQRLEPGQEEMELSTGVVPDTIPDPRRRDLEELSDNEMQGLSELADEDAQSLVGISISEVATRLKSAMTPAAEKAAAMDDPDGGGLFPSDEDIATVPELEREHPAMERELNRKNSPSERVKLYLGELPPRELQDQGFPTPWVAGPRPLILDRPDETRSVLRDAFGVSKRRSLSGGADTLKKFLPSIPKAGSFLPNVTSNSIFSSSYQKGRSRALSLYREYIPPSLNSSNKRDTSPSQPTRSNQRSLGGSAASPTQSLASECVSNPQPQALRRTASDDSLLYHTLSRASSLGDDTRFENHHEMVNSRVKAIRDSLQDRSSFKLPTLPTLNWKGKANSTEDILPGNAKKKMSVIPNPALQSGMVGASISRPEAVINSVTPLTERIIDSHMERAMANLAGDLVIMGGYRGSILRSAKPPHRQLWVPVKVGLNIRKVNMEVGLDPEDEERMEERIYSSGMLQNIGPVDISRRLFKRLRECENARNGTLRIWDYGYDWRLSPHLLSKKLIKFIENLPSNQPGVANRDRGALVIAHSLGGLLTRHAVNQRPELFSGIIYAGVPQACVNILGPLRNGDAVLLSSRVLTAQVNFTLRTSFVLLPLEGYCFVDKYTKEEYPVDFFDVEDWIRYRLSPCTDAPLPPKAQPSGGLVNILKQGSITSLRRLSQNQPAPPFNEAVSSGTAQHSSPTLAAHAAEVIQDSNLTDQTLAPQIGNSSNPVKRGQSTNSSVSTAVTIPREKAINYLRRTLTETKQFKLELAHKAEYSKANRYPPLAIIYGKSVPTVYAARVDGRDGIACADCYDDLAFASGDGVCLSREAMLPDGYHLANGGRISSDRGHVGLLGDLNAVGRAIQAVTKARAKGLGLGLEQNSE